MNGLVRALHTLWNDESGQDLIEYALISGLIGLSCVAAMGSLASSLVSSFTSIGATLTNAF